MKLIRSTRKGKRFAAVIDTPQGQKTYHFGSDGSAYIDHGDEHKKAADCLLNGAKDDRNSSQHQSCKDVKLIMACKLVPRAYVGSQFDLTVCIQSTTATLRPGPE